MTQEPPADADEGDAGGQDQEWACDGPGCRRRALLLSSQADGWWVLDRVPAAATEDQLGDLDGDLWGKRFHDLDCLHAYVHRVIEHRGHAAA